MKRLVLVLLFVLLAFVSSSSTGQPVRDGGRSVGATRVAVVNVGHVFHKYKRAVAFKAEIDELLRGPKAEAARLIAEGRKWEEAIKAGDFDFVSKEQYETRLKKIKRQLEDLDADMRKAIGKRQEDNLMILWKEVQQGVREYAAKHNLELVLGYGDPMEARDLELFPNVNRKMQAMDTGGTVPLFVSERVEISAGVVELLNNQFREGKDVD